MTYTLSVNGIESDTLSATATSRFHITKKKQLLDVKFEGNQTRVREQLTSFQKSKDEGLLWIELRADFQWVAKILAYPYQYKHTYFTGRIKYTGLFLDENDFGKSCIFFTK